MTRACRRRLGAPAVLVAALLLVSAAAEVELDGHVLVGAGTVSASSARDATTTKSAGGEKLSGHLHAENPRASVALVVDVSLGREALPEHAPLWRGVAHALSSGGSQRVTILLVAGENVSAVHPKNMPLPSLRNPRPPCPRRDAATRD